MNNTYKKRPRSNNYTNEEVSKLIKLVVKYRNVIETKKTDAVSWNEKDSTWHQIEKEFNAICIQCPRSKKNLKMKYVSLKKDLKKKISKNNSEIKKTGGDFAKIDILTSDEEQLLSILSLPLTGTPYDNDSHYSDNPEKQVEIETIFLENDDIQEEEFQDEIDIVKTQIDLTNDPVGDHHEDVTEEDELHMEDSPSTLQHNQQDYDNINVQEKQVLTRSASSLENVTPYTPRCLKKRKILINNSQRKAYTVLIKLKQRLIKEQIKLLQKDIELRDEELKEKKELHEIKLKSSQIELEMKRKELEKYS